MEKLKEVESPRGTGIPNLRATLIKRTDDKAIYKRNDGVYEVFKIKIQEKREAFGREFPHKEMYPGNEDFGNSAWCYVGKDQALKRYENL